jgi:hypothetical protein
MITNPVTAHSQLSQLYQGVSTPTHVFPSKEKIGNVLRPLPGLLKASGRVELALRNKRMTEGIKSILNNAKPHRISKGKGRVIPEDMGKAQS